MTADSATPPMVLPVTQAIEDMYKRFAVQIPRTIEGCPCCIDTRNIDVLLTTPLRRISGQAIWRYVSGAFLTVGGERDFKYLLPRILELSVTEPDEANSPEIVLGKLSLAHWRSWPADQQDAVEAVVEAWFDATAAREAAEAAFPSSWETESLLCGIARAGMPLTPKLARLEDPAAAAVVTDMADRFPTKASGFWEDVPDAHARLSAALAGWAG